MKNEKIKCFVGNYILPYGRPTVFITGWETDTEFFCERFILFETDKNELICSGICSNVNKAEYLAVSGMKDDNEVLEKFMDREGRRLSEADIFYIANELMKDKMFSEYRIELVESEILVNLYHIKKKFPDKLVWFKRNTKCDEFKNLIDLTSSLNLTVTEYH
jgi:hypothetical protein